MDFWKGMVSIPKRLINISDLNSSAGVSSDSDFHGIPALRSVCLCS